MTKTPLQILDDTIALLRKGWCQGPFAKDGVGAACDPLDDHACTFCLSGAMIRSDRHEVSSSFTQARKALLAEAELRGFDTYVQFNEHPGRTQEEVIALVERARGRVRV